MGRDAACTVERAATPALLVSLGVELAASRLWTIVFAGHGQAPMSSQVSSMFGHTFSMRDGAPLYTKHVCDKGAGVCSTAA